MKNIMNSTKDISELQDEINFNESCIKELPALLNDEIERTKETYEQRIANTTNEIFIKKLTAMLNEQIEELKKLYEQREESYKEEIEKCNRAIKELKGANTMNTNTNTNTKKEKVINRSAWTDYCMEGHRFGNGFERDIYSMAMAGLISNEDLMIYQMHDDM